MKVEGQHTLPFSRSATWEALMDPSLLSRTLPGCDELTEAGEGAWTGKMRVQVGPVRGVFKGKLEISDAVEGESYRMRLEGQGPTGFMDGGGTIRLSDAEGGCILAYDLDFQVGGRIAGVGQRVLESSARAVAGQGLEGLEREMTARAGGAAAVAAPETGDVGAGAGEGSAVPGGGRPTPSPAPRSPSGGPAAGPSQAEMAARIARDVAADLVPPEARGWLAAGFLFFLGLAIGRLWRGR